MSLTILIADDEKNFRHFIVSYLRPKGYEVLEASKLDEARDLVNRGAVDILILDVGFPEGSGLTLLEEIMRMPVHPQVIMLTAFGDMEMAVEAMKSGATDFLAKPAKLDQLEKSIVRAGDIVSLKRELAHLRKSQHDQLDYIIGENPKMNLLFDQAQRAATSSVSVLITGETGTGKEILARAIHKMGPRSNKPFIDVNCPAIQPTMIESELFGHEAHAFTSAEKRKHGLMEVADGGILFLDEISSMPVDMQAKLLRALQEHTFRRVGGTALVQVDVQIIAASNRNLRAMIEKGEFRDDLYYRLKVVDLEMPPLRDHKEDIPELVGLFIRQNNPHKGLNITDVNPRAMQVLMAHDWPGNVRELHNVIERAMIFCDDAAIDLAHLPLELVERYAKGKHDSPKNK